MGGDSVCVCERESDLVFCLGIHSLFFCLLWIFTRVILCVRDSVSACECVGCVALGGLGGLGGFTDMY